MKTINYKELIAPSLVLIIICLVVTAVLAGTYQVTKPIIEEINIKNANLARAEVLPEGAGGFSLVDVELMENVAEVYEADNGSGMVFTTVDKGFGGTITVMTGISSSGEIEGIKVTSHTETPGLGTKAMTPEYLSQYSGQSAVAIEGADANVDAVTGATISSKAIFRAVETALEQYKQLGGAN